MSRYGSAKMLGTGSGRSASVSTSDTMAAKKSLPGTMGP